MVISWAINGICWGFLFPSSLYQLPRKAGYLLSRHKIKEEKLLKDYNLIIQYLRLKSQIITPQTL